MQLDGRPLRHVRVAIDDVGAITDNAGNFLLSGLPPGHHELHVYGGTANSGDRHYGTFEIGVDLVAGQSNVLPSTIWMTPLDLAAEMPIGYPTSVETVLTTPQVPGLEVRIPAGSEVRDEDGRPVRALGITAIPLDKPPFALPMLGANPPVYFTVQPGDAYVYPTGARVIYPNSRHLAANERVEFWNYDPTEKGWHIYGHGRVTPDRRQVVPEPGTVIYNFAGAMFNSGNTPPPQGPPPGGCNGGGDPVDCSTGLFTHSETDLSLNDTLPIGVTRTYRQDDPTTRAFGIGTSLSLDLFLWSAQQYQEVDLVLPDGGRVHYPRISTGTGFSDTVFEHTNSPTIFYKSRIVWVGGGWQLRLRDGTTLDFRQYRPLSAITDRFGNKITIDRGADGTGPPESVTSSSGLWISFVSDSAGRITEASDSSGRTVTYGYDATGRLVTVTDPVGGITRYTYDAAHRMLTWTPPRGITSIRNAYDGAGRVATQTLADGGVFTFAYTLSGARVSATLLTDPRGRQTRTTFNGAGFATSQTTAVGTPLAQTTTYTRDASNLVTSMQDPLNRTTTAAYDASGNMTSLTLAAGTASAATWTASYDSTFSQLTSSTDPLGSTTTFGRDARGALTSVTDPLMQVTRVVNDPSGRPTQITSPANAVTTIGYVRGSEATVTDPLGRVSRRWSDAAGRPAYATDPVGNVTSVTFDALDRITAVRDAAGTATTLTYDANGNLTSLTDPGGGVSRWTYDNKDRRATAVDPLTRTESFGYDGNDNLTTHTDRRGTVMNASYDVLDRPSSISWGTTVTDTFGYDAGDRLTSASSVPATPAGTITRRYDLLDRPISEQTAQGVISYDYDQADRITAKTVTGQPAISYTYDAAGQLIAATRGTDVVATSYDADGRATGRTLPNGVRTDHAYDATGEVTGLTWTRGATAVGNVAYTYDQAGWKSSVSGTLGAPRLPAAIASATYDAANQLTEWGAGALTYDPNGNLTTEGGRTYTWDARGALTAIAGTTTASFGYDTLGRRTTSTVTGATRTFVYDGVTPVQELTGAAPAANMLTGPGVDEFLARYETGTTSYYVSDEMGSTLGLTDPAGALPTTYAYQPFGSTTTLGAASTNPYQYTGRENDDTSLYYLRNRYYSPGLHRFASEDPLGFPAGQPNLHVYVGDNPINFTDPFGLDGNRDRGDGDDVTDKAKELGWPILKGVGKGLKRGGPYKQMYKMDKGIKREAGKEYTKLIKDADKTRKEAVDPFTKRLRDLWRRATDALAGTDCP